MHTKPAGLMRESQETGNLLRFFLGSAVGISIYFVPFTIGGKNTIFLDHLVTVLITKLPVLCALFALGLILLGSVLPFYEKSWNRDISSLVMTCLKVLGAVLSVMAFFRLGPEWLLRPDMLPLLFYNVALSVALIVPVGSFFLTFLTNYGLLGFLGVLLQPVMRPLWKVPGMAAVNVVASFVGSFSVGIFMADRLYKEKKFTQWEAAVIITGFSTVSATFMVIIARNLDLMNHWNTFFLTTVFVTFLVSLLTVRLYPLKDFGEDEHPKEMVAVLHEKRFSQALQQALIDVEGNKNLGRSMLINVKEGIMMSLRFLPLILSVGTIAFVAARMTPLFDMAAFVFYPLVLLLGIPEPLIVSTAIVTSGVDVIMPSLMISGIDIPVESRFTVGVVSISSVLFLSGTIPCILSTGIRMSLNKLLLILLERMVLSLLLMSLFIRVLF